MLHRLISLIACAGVTAPATASMDNDPEARALLKVFRSMEVTQTYLDDNFDDESVDRKITGPLTFTPGRSSEKNAVDKAITFPDQRLPEQYVYYGPYVPIRGKFSLHFRTDALPTDHNFMTLFSTGTAGNTCMTVRLYLDMSVKATVWTKRERVTTFTDAVAMDKWHHLEFYYGPEGSLMTIDGAIEDYSTDWSVPYAHNRSNAFYLGDQPWWDANKKAGVFYPKDGFVGRIDNLRLERVELTAAPTSD